MAATKEWRKAYYDKKIASFIEYLGGKCMECGSTIHLEIDHIDRTLKAFSPTSFYDRKWEIVKEELDKCQLLCKSCHLIKSWKNGDIPLPATHGTYAMYRHHKCRCEDCRMANRLQQRLTKERKALKA